VLFRSVFALTPDYRIAFGNRFFFERFPESSRSRSRCHEMFKKRPQPCTRCPATRVFATGEPQVWEWTSFRNRVYQIHNFPFTAEDGAPLVLELGIDVTARKRAEAALREREAAFRSILLAAPVGIGLVQKRIFRWASTMLTDMVGYAEEELLGQSARILYESEEEFEQVGASKYEQIERAGVGEVETVWRRKDGRRIDVLLRSAPIEPSDLGAGVTFTALDITERRRAEEERQELQNQIQHVQKLESLGVLAGGIAHDFNNLLMAILGNANLALEELSPTSPARQNIMAIEKAARRSADLCRQMLAYSGRGKFIVQPLRLDELVREMTHMLEISISKKAVLKYNFGANVPAIEADATQVRQVIMNLIVNASEAIGDRSGVISMSTGAMLCDRPYLTEIFLHENLAEGLYVYLEVADTGCGMDADIQAKLFDPFFTTKFTGRGLGMSAVLGIVRGHRGGIKIYSEPGRGTTIKVLFPAREAVMGSRPAERSDSLPPPGDIRGGLILLVDDEETVRAVGKQMLERLGFTVLTAADGREALEIFRQQPAKIDCVVLDLTMPHMDGEEAFRELRRIRSDVRVLLSSGYNEQDVTQRFVGKGLAGFIQKPYTLAPLQEAIFKVLAKKE